MSHSLVKNGILGFCGFCCITFVVLSLSAGFVFIFHVTGILKWSIAICIPVGFWGILFSLYALCCLSRKQMNKKTIVVSSPPPFTIKVNGRRDSNKLSLPKIEEEEEEKKSPPKLPERDYE